jgi:hypothetical protein
MKLGHTNDEIKYVETVGTTAIYLLVLDGEPTMQIVCNTADADKTIRIARAGATAGTLPTKGQFATKTELLTDADGGPLGTETRVDEKSVYTYVVPRLHVLLGRLLRAA